MKPVKEFSGVVKETAEIVVDIFNRQLEQLVRLVRKPPIKPPLSWESIIGESLTGKVHRPVVAKPVIVPELPEANQKLAQLSLDVFDELLRRIEKNVVDEVQAIRLYEKLFDCEVQILRGHVHFYKCKTNKDEETIDYTMLITRLLKLFAEHKDIVARRTDMAH